LKAGSKQTIIDTMTTATLDAPKQTQRMGNFIPQPALLPRPILVTESQFFRRVNSYLKCEDQELVKAAFTLARQEHGTQRRKSGELFFTHPLTVAYYLAEYHLDAPALVAALLHDIAEDTKVSLADIAAQFGEEVAQLVGGVTRLKDVSLGVAKESKRSPQEVADATLVKLLDVATRDVRVVLIKLFDRLHNMRTITAMPPHKQRQKAQETITVYAPLANRLGIWAVKNELEALSLQVLEPDAYRLLRERLNQIREQHQSFFELVSGQIFDCLLRAGLDVRHVSIDPENIYTVYLDQNKAGVSYKEVDETLRLVVLLNDWQACYGALGYLHKMWGPVLGQFDDYIAAPRDNLYRSLHTMVVHTEKQKIKLRLRTVAMDEVSRIGVLTRWLYAGTPLWTKGIADRIDDFFNNISAAINVEPQDPSASAKGLVEDVLPEQMHVYTPQGDVHTLPQGATAIDFAYKIHTGLGDQCHGAWVNGLRYPLNRPLKDGDHVLIIKKATAQPQRAWLDEHLGYTRTGYARSHARRWFRRLPKREAIAQGKELLTSELEMLGLPGYPHGAVAAAFKYDNEQRLYYDLGRAEILPTAVSAQVLKDIWSEGPERDLDTMVTSMAGEHFIVTNANGRDLRLCGTCRPRPRQTIVGYLRTDGGVTVHGKDCHTLQPSRQAGRLLKLEWGETTPRKARLLNIEIQVFDRPSLLYEITDLIHGEQINIAFIHTPMATKDGKKYIELCLEIVDPDQAVRVLHQIQGLINVTSVRILSGRPPQ
jgi:GTP diphosphokinase / guanosine-3',5'-bis(diphosphate) 3'-diphosphatase